MAAPHTTEVYPPAVWFTAAFKALEEASRKQPNGEHLADNRKLTLENLQLKAWIASLQNQLDSARAVINQTRRGSHNNNNKNDKHTPKQPPAPQLPADYACVKCGKDRRVYVARPCKHLCLCATCTPDDDHHVDGTPCPVCRRPVSFFMRIF